MITPEEAAAVHAAAGETAPETQTPTTPQTEAERLAAELREANDRVLRAQAEFENFRKRVRRELEDERKYAALVLLRDLLPVFDNLQRAIESAEQAGNSGVLLDGVKMVVLLMNGLFEQHGCKKIVSIGAPFDPNLHEALAQAPSAEYAAGTIMREARAGYVLHDRVVRPAQVFVSTGPQA